MELEDLKNRMHSVMDEMGVAIKPKYGFAICMKYQEMCDNEIEAWAKQTRENKES